MLDEIDLLFMQLDWPVPMTRVLAAQEIAKLLSLKKSPYKKRFLTWLQSRTLESEVVSGIAILGLVNTPPIEMEKVQEAIQCPSILADLYLEDVYKGRQVEPEWLEQHSGEPDVDYTPSEAFVNKQRSNIIAPMFSKSLRNIEEKYGVPIARQWAWEYDSLQKRQPRYSPRPDYFLDAIDRRESTGHYFVKEMDVFLSAFIRSFAFAVSHWDMPIGYARFYSSQAATIDTKLARIEAKPKPSFWYNTSGIPDTPLTVERFTQELEKLATTFDDEIIIGARGSFIKNKNYAADMEITAFVCEKGATVTLQEQRGLHENSYVGTWWESDFILGTHLPDDAIQDFYKKFSNQRVFPLAFRLFLIISYPRWLTDRLSGGLLWPSPDYFADDLEAKYTPEGILFYSGSECIGRLIVWHSDWEISNLKGQDSGVGLALLFKKQIVGKLLQKSNDDLRLLGKVSYLTRDREYGEYTPGEMYSVSSSLNLEQ